MLCSFNLASVSVNQPHESIVSYGLCLVCANALLTTLNSRQRLRAPHNVTSTSSQTSNRRDGTNFSGQAPQTSVAHHVIKTNYLQTILITDCYIMPDLEQQEYP